MPRLIEGKIAYDFNGRGVSVLVDVDGKEVRALVTEEALQDKAHSSTADPAELVALAKMFGVEIAWAVQRKVAKGQLQNNVAVIHSGEL